MHEYYSWSIDSAMYIQSRQGCYYWLGPSVAKQRVSQNNEVKGCILTYYIPSLPLIKLNKT